MRLVVHGQTGIVSADPEQPGAQHDDWVSGPTSGYGFSPPRRESSGLRIGAFADPDGSLLRLVQNG